MTGWNETLLVLTRLLLTVFCWSEFIYFMTGGIKGVGTQCAKIKAKTQFLPFFHIESKMDFESNCVLKELH